MRWKRSIAIAVVVLLLLLVAHAVLHRHREDSEILPVSVDVTEPFYAVYFGSADGTQLIPEFHQGVGTVEERVARLMEGPRLAELSAVFPEDVEFLGYSQRDDVLFLNFSHHLVTRHPGGSTGEIMTVYGIVNTLVGAWGVRQVQILVEGRQILTLAGHLDLTEPLEKDYELLGSSHI